MQDFNSSGKLNVDGSMLEEDKRDYKRFLTHLEARDLLKRFKEFWQGDDDMGYPVHMYEKAHMMHDEILRRMY